MPWTLQVKLFNSYINPTRIFCATQSICATIESAQNDDMFRKVILLLCIDVLTGSCNKRISIEPDHERPPSLQGQGYRPNQQLCRAYIWSTKRPNWRLWLPRRQQQCRCFCEIKPTPYNSQACVQYSSAYSQLYKALIIIIICLLHNLDEARQVVFERKSYPP